MDQLFLIEPDFQDPDFPGRRFYCWHCVLIEGLLSIYPSLQQKINIFRIDWMRPRTRVIAEVGPDNQSLPLLVLSEGKESRHQTGSWQGRSFIADKDAILRYFSEEFGISEAHP